MAFLEILLATLKIFYQIEIYCGFFVKSAISKSSNLKGFSLTGELGHEDKIIIVIIAGGILFSVKLSEWLLKGLGIILERLFSSSVVSTEQEQRALENAISIPIPNCEEITSQIAEAGSIAIELIPTNGDVAGFISNVSAEVLDQIADTLSCSGKFDVTRDPNNSHIMRIESGDAGSSRRLTIPQRLQEFYRRLGSSERASSAEEGLQQVRDRAG